MAEYKTSIIDLPRNTGKGDKDNFDIETYEKGLTKFIENADTPITIALQGEWGSGKTSLMNSLLKNLNGDDGSYHAVWLNTWEYALMKDTQETLKEILTGLIKEISIIGGYDQEKTKQLVKKLWGVGKSVIKIAANTAVSGAGQIVDDIFEEKGNSTIKEIRDELQSVINESISNSGKKGFIFFIDDLDRVDPPMAVELLELLKNIFTLKNSVFILAIDYDVVVKGLEPKFGKLTSENEREFRSFFDKIIQVPFSMPVGNYKIDDFLKDSLIAINYITKEQGESETFMHDIVEIANLSVGTNPRSLKRLLNSLSLIKCINDENSNDSSEDDKLDDIFELMTNFALVSIQIAYPPVYELLNKKPGFDLWDEKVAMQLNLKKLNDESINKLKTYKEFDEEWEQVLFRLCESDYYLKKKALSISRLLDKIKTTIEGKQETVEDIVKSIIKFSSVTALNITEETKVSYHIGTFLKSIRWKLIEELKRKLPEIKDEIGVKGKKVRTNAKIEFLHEKWPWINLQSWPSGSKVKLKISAPTWMAPTKKANLFECIKEAGMGPQFEALEKEYNSQFINKYHEFETHNFNAFVSKNQGTFVLHLSVSLDLESTEAFTKPEILNRLGMVCVDLYNYQLKLAEIGQKTTTFYNKMKPE